MTPDEAYAHLHERLVFTSHGELPPDAVSLLRTSWKALDAALRGSGELPYPWARLNALAAAHRAGKPDTASWQTLVAKGYAPPADGEDSAGRAWWHPATVDAYVRGAWKAAPRQRDPDEAPPITGAGAGRDRWAEFAERRGIAVTPGMRRDAIQRACRDLGLIN